MQVTERQIIDNRIALRRKSAIQSEAARNFAIHAESDNTRRAYTFGFNVDFSEKFCKDLGYSPLPATPAVIIEYITWLSDHVKVSTIEARLAAVSFAHRTAGIPDPVADHEVKLVMKGLRNKMGKPPRRVEPLVNKEMARVIRALPRTLRGTRDRALLLVGYACALRRSELAAITVRDCSLDTDLGELTVKLPRRKTDQAGHGTTIVVPKTGGILCAVTALRNWLNKSGIMDGPVFLRIDRWDHIIGNKRLDGNSIARLIKADVKQAGLDPAKFSGHSLRAGFVTSASDADVPEYRIRQVTGHKSRALQDYIRDQGRGGRKAIEAVLRGTDARELHDSSKGA